MRDYMVCYKDGTSKDIEVCDKQELIDILFGGSEKDFKEKVSLLKWQTASMFYTENVATGKIDPQMSTADTNPYGWRNEANSRG